MSPRKPEVTVTTFHALDPRECTCADGACIAAAIERTTALDAPGVARCEPDAGEGDVDAAASRKGGRT